MTWSKHGCYTFPYALYVMMVTKEITIIVPSSNMRDRRRTKTVARILLYIWQGNKKRRSIHREL